MTDLVIGVRVTADGSGLVGQLGPAEAAVRGIKQEATAAAGAAAQLGAASARAGQDARRAAGALNEQGQATGELERTLTRLENRYDQAGAPMRRYMQDLADISRLQKAGAIDTEHAALFTQRAGQTYEQATRRQREMNKAQRDGAASAQQQRAAYTNLGYQVQDISQQLALGVNPLVVLAQQGGQTASALQMMGGKGAGVAAFFAGPWGSAIIAAVTVVGMLTMAFLENEEAAGMAEAGADALGQAQSAMGELFDLTSGKIKAQNELLVLNARLMAINLRAEAQSKRASAEGTFTEAGEFSAGERIAAFLNRGGGTSPGERMSNVEAQRDVFRGYVKSIREARTEKARADALERALTETEKLPIDNMSGVSANEWRQALIDLATSSRNEAVAGMIDRSLDSGVLDPGLRRSGPQKRERKKRDNSAQLEEFGEDAANRIDAIAGRFSDQPKAIEQARKALAELDDLMDDIRRKKPLNMDELLEDAAAAKTTVREGLIRGLVEPFEKHATLADRAKEALAALDKVAADFQERKPPGWEGFIAQIDEARQTVEDGLNRPIDELLQQQEEALQIQYLINAGRHDEAAALRIILQLEKVRGPLAREQKQAILENVQALREEERAMDVLRQKQLTYLEALDDVRSIVTDILSGNLKALEDAPKRLLDAFQRMVGRYLEEKLFGNVFRQLEDQISGVGIVEDASKRMGSAVDTVSADLQRLGGAVRDATAGLAAAGSGSGGAVEAASDAIGASVADALASLLPGRGDAQAAGVVAVVNGQRTTLPAGSNIPRDPAGFFSYTIEKLAQGVLGENAAKAIGKYSGKALEGAAVGSMVAGVGKMLGIKTSTTGGQIGGAIGSMIPIPGGEIIGSIIGSVLGGALKKTKTGSATLGIGADGLMVSGTSGSSSKYRTAASAMGDSVIEMLEGIAAQFGGALTGSPSVSIGIRDGKYRVDTSGRGITKTKKGAVDFGDDQAAALAFATLDALRDGVITGLSEAVRKALNSSDNLEKAIQEAMKVDELETLLGGLDAELGRGFKAFERQAAERLRIAQKYGFDLVKLEEVNAKERAKLLDDILESRIGSLQALLDDLKFGDLFEGSAAEQRQKLLVEIAAAETDAKAGVDGAADKVADLRRRLLELSRDAFGTAGPEYAADRDSSREAAEEIIRIENERVKAAQDAAIAANQKLDTANQLADEGNDLAAERLAVLRDIRGLLGGAAAAALGGDRTGSLARVVDLRNT